MSRAKEGIRVFDFERPSIEVVEISDDKKYGRFVVEQLIRESRKSSSTEAVMFIRARLQPLPRQHVKLALISKEGRLTHETCND